MDTTKEKKEKSPRQKPTQRQRKFAKALINNQLKDKPDNITYLSESVGYSKETARTQQKRVLQAEGTKEALKEYGFDEDSAKRYLSNVLNKPNKEANGVRACELIFKVVGSFAPEKKNIKVTSIEDMPPEELNRYRNKIADGTITDDELDMINGVI